MKTMMGARGMHRRGLLVAFVGAAVAGTLVSNNALALSGVEWRYSETVRLAREVVALSNGHRVPGKRWSSSSPEVSEAVERLLQHVLHHFPVMPSNDETRDLLAARGDLGALDEARLSRMAESLVPVAVMREIIRTHGVGFNPRQCPSYDDFVARYAPALIG